MRKFGTQGKGGIEKAPLYRCIYRQPTNLMKSLI